MTEERASYVCKAPPADSPVGQAMKRDEETYLRVLNAFMVECVDLIESLARQHTFVNEETGETNSGGISTDADALLFLHKHGRFQVMRSAGRLVMGYWPENLPKERLDDGHP